MLKKAEPISIHVGGRYEVNAITTEALAAVCGTNGPQAPTKLWLVSRQEPDSKQAFGSDSLRLPAPTPSGPNRLPNLNAGIQLFRRRMRQEASGPAEMKMMQLLQKLVTLEEQIKRNVSNARGEVCA